METDTKWKQYYKTENDYRNACLEKMDIELGELSDNSGLRFISKICLNSLWGKFGQRKFKKETKYVIELPDFYNTLLNDKIENLSFSFPNEDICIMNYDHKNEFIKDNFNTNIYISCFTTSSARIRLYKMLDKLGERVVYYDTDSIVYADNGEPIETGCLLGEWADELSGDSIIEWICNASKDYAYITRSGKMKGAHKGFRINSETEEYLTFENMKNIVFGDVKEIEISDTQMRIQSDRSIKNAEITKVYKHSFDKRYVLKNKDTLPFGYIF